MTTKPFYLSKTFWVNIVLAGLVMAFPALSDKATPEVVATIFGVVNIVLRVISHDKLSLS